MAHLSHHISWPTGQALCNSDLGFCAAECSYTTSAVDGWHIPTVKPHCENPVVFLNRKQFYSVVLIGLCDSKGRFCHYNVGHPGSLHDARYSSCLLLDGRLKKIPSSWYQSECTILGNRHTYYCPSLWGQTKILVIKLLGSAILIRNKCCMHSHWAYLWHKKPHNCWNSTLELFNPPSCTQR